MARVGQSQPLPFAFLHHAGLSFLISSSLYYARSNTCGDSLQKHRFLFVRAPETEARPRMARIQFQRLHGPLDGLVVAASVYVMPGEASQEVGIDGVQLQGPLSFRHRFFVAAQDHKVMHVVMTRVGETWIDFERLLPTSLGFHPVPIVEDLHHGQH